MRCIYLSILLALLLPGCKSSHEHDGLYIANEQITGVTRAWIIEGEVLTVYTAGVAEVKEIEQKRDYIVVDDDKTYYFNSQGGIIVPVNVQGKEIVMSKYSAKTKYNYCELEKIIDAAVPLKFKR